MQQGDRWRLVRHNQSVDLDDPSLAEGRMASAVAAAEPADRSVGDADAVA